MATAELPERPEEIQVEPLDLVGHYERGHLSHVGFVWTQAALSFDNEVEVIDARPVRRNHDRIPAHVVGRLGLTRRQRLAMVTWLEREQRARSLAGDFIARDDALRDPVTGRIIVRQRSCAALVLACLEACTDVVLVDLGAIPTSARDRLEKIWGERAVQMANFRTELPGDGPWAVVLPGHIFHSLAREDPRASALRPAAEHWDVPLSKSPP